MTEISIWRGGTDKITWICKSPTGTLADLTGYRFILTVAGPHDVALITMDTAIDNDFWVDLATSSLFWFVSHATSRLLPRGRLSTYELEARVGPDQDVVDSGYITGRGGINSDT
jgi:hypothetical protein